MTKEKVLKCIDIEIIGLQYSRSDHHSISAPCFCLERINFVQTMVALTDVEWYKLEIVEEGPFYFGANLWGAST